VVVVDWQIVRCLFTEEDAKRVDAAEENDRRTLALAAASNTFAVPRQLVMMMSSGFQREPGAGASSFVRSSAARWTTRQLVPSQAKRGRSRTFLPSSRSKPATSCPSSRSDEVTHATDFSAVAGDECAWRPPEYSLTALVRTTDVVGNP